MKTIKFLSALIIGMMIVSSIPLFATAQEDVNDTLVIALQADMEDMNSWNPDTNAVWKSNQLGWNYETLMTYNPDFEIYPVLAADGTGANGADVTITNGGMNIAVKLKEGITFHDGEEMTSRDVVFSYQTLAWGLFQTQVLGPLYWDDGTLFEDWNGTADMSRIGVQANGTYGVDFFLTTPYAMFWYSTMALPICPAHIWVDEGHLVPLANADLPGYEVEAPQMYGWDYSYGADASETDATIGTGPMYLESWIPEQGSVIKAYEGYWDIDGVTTWGGVEYPNYPLFVKTIKFKIYTQLDVAILALQNGEVHHLPWSLTPGYYNLLKTDPNIGIQTPKDQGLFYMSFNMRKGAMADVNFRRAVSYCVDKDYIVNRLMGGYGIKGSVPMSVTNTFYVNTSVPAWIQGGDLEAAKALLDSSGYVDADGDGWRDMPDGSPLKYNILTPPKDYDPIRADSGIMIEKNLKAIGLNVAAVPTSFDTIVSAAYVSVDFDMYILGWTVGSFPEAYLRDFFHSSADTAVNPAGSNAGGYDNPAFDAMVDDLEVEMDTEVRAQMVKDACGMVMNDVAYNTLYYRTNIEAFRGDIWQGWIPAFGTIYNGFSIFNLAPPTSDGGGGGSSGGSATLSGIEGKINAPSMIGAEQTISGSVIATEILELDGVSTTAPSVGASVHITTSLGNDITGTTDVNGMVSFNFEVPYQKLDSVIIDANISKSGAWTNINKTVDVKFTNHIAQLSLSTADGVIAPGATTTVTATVTDENGDPIEGVNVDVDTALMFGTVDAATKATNANGTAAFTYTAPLVGMLPNTHRFEQFKANISVANTIVPEIQSSSLIIGISSSLYDWHSLDITDVTAYVLDNDNTTASPDNTTITVELTDQDGTAVEDYDVDMVLSVDGTVIDASAMTVATDANGMADFTLTVNSAYTGTGTVIATFSTEKSYSIKDSVALYIRDDPTFTQDVYHLDITGVSRDVIYNHYNNTDNTTTIDVVLYNSTWAPVDGADLYMALSDDTLVSVSTDYMVTDANGTASFNITCDTNGTANISVVFGINDSIGIFEGYNLKVNNTPATIVAVEPVLNEMVFGPSVEDSKYWYNLVGIPTDHVVKVWNPAYGWKPDLAQGVNYTLTGNNITYINKLWNGDSVFVWYNYTISFENESVVTNAVGGETTCNLDYFPILDPVNATIYKNDSVGAWTKLEIMTDYTIDNATGAITLVAALVADDDVFAYYNYSAPVANATVFAGPAVAGETGVLGTLANPVVDYTIYNEIGGVYTELTDTTDYTLVTSTGVYTQITPLNAGESIYAFYNYTYNLDHHMLAVTDVSSYYIDVNPFANATPETSYVTVQLTDTDGHPMNGVEITAIPSGDVVVDNPYQVTDAAGNAVFNVSATTDMAISAAVYFQVNDTAGISETVTLWNAEYVPGYAADIDFTGIADSDSTMDITATVYGADGNPAVGVPCQFFIPPTAEGIPGVFQGGDEWGFYEYGEDMDMGWYAGYLGSWFENNATVTDGSGQLAATIDTASFVADVAIPLEFGVGGTGTTHGFTVSNNNWWWEDPYTWGYDPSYPPMTDGADGEYYWMDADFTMTDQVILKRAPLAVLTGVAMNQPFLSASDNTTTVTLTFQDLAGPLATTDANFGEGTAKPTILDDGTTSATGVYTYDYTIAAGDFDSGIGFTSVITDSAYAKFPFNFYLPYLAGGTDAQALVVSVDAADYSLTIGDDITLDVLVTDEYGRLQSGVTLDIGDVTATTDATGVAQLTVSTAAVTDAGLYTINIDASKGTLATEEETSVVLSRAAEPEPETVGVVIGPVLDEDGNPIVGALVTITIGGVNYTGTTNSTGYATIDVPADQLGEEATITITADGYEDTTYTTTLGADGTPATNPPEVVAVDDGTDMTMIIIIVVIVVAVIGLLAMMMMKKGGKPPAAEPMEEEPPMEEPAPIEEIAQEPIVDEPLPPDEFLPIE